MKIYLFQVDADLGKGSMPPLGLLSLATYLKKHGFSDIHVIDLLVEENRKKALIQALKEINPREKNLIGFYMNTRIRFVVQEAIHIAEKILPQALICAGGPHPTLDPQGTLKGCQELDFIVRGEGEETFLEVVKALSRDFQITALKDILGVSSHQGGEIKHNPQRPRIKDLDVIPIADRDLVDMSAYAFSFPVMDPDLQERLKPASMMTSRGCPYHCIFCSVAEQWGRFNTYHSPDRVVEEMKLLKTKYGFNGIYFFDDNFTLRKDRVTAICQKILEADLGMYWFCEITANTVDEELLSLMYKAGLRSAAVGLESANPRILKEVVKKGISLEQIEKTIKICNKFKIYIKVFVSYSYPGETLEDVKHTLNFIKTTTANAPVKSPLFVYPGTPLFQIAKDKKILPEDFGWFTKYPYYNTLSNPTTVPLFLDKLSVKDFIWIRAEIRSLAKQRALAQKVPVRKKSLFSLGLSFLRALKKVKSRYDIAILKEKIWAVIKR